MSVYHRFFFVCNSQAQALGETVPENFDKATIFTNQDVISDTTLPLSVDLTLKIPPAGNQNPRGACWAFASTYSIVSYIGNTNRSDNFFLLNDGTPDYSKIMSPELPLQLFFKNKIDCDEGANSLDLLKKTLLEYGSISLKALPFSYKCNVYPKNEIISLAKNKIKINYDVEVIRRDDLLSMKKILSTGQPLLISIEVDDNFTKIRNGVHEKFRPLWSEYGLKVGGHAMTIVGYNDSLQAVKVLNSWGQSWGNDGYVWITYKLLNNFARYYCYPVYRPEIASLALVDSVKKETSMTKSFSSTKILATWFKQGFYRKFDNFRIGLSYLNQDSNFALINIRDNFGSLKFNFYIDAGTTKEFSLNEHRYFFTFINIGKIGKNFFKKAMFFTVIKQ